MITPELKTLDTWERTSGNMRAPSERKMLNQDFVNEFAVRVHLFLEVHKFLDMREDGPRVGGVE